MRNRIRELREEARLTQAELAKLLDVTESDVSRWESGKRPLSPAAIDKIAGVFKISTWELFMDRKALRRMVADTDAKPEMKIETAEGSRDR